MLQRIALTLFILATACSRSSNKLTLSPDDSTFNLNAPTAMVQTLTVVNRDNQGIAGARILIGDGASDQNRSRLITADSKGRFAIPDTWNPKDPITVDAPGYIRATYWGLGSRQNTLQLNQLDGNEKIKLSGLTTGYPSLAKDDWVDFSLIMPSLTREELFGFDMSLVLSPEVDHISAAGQDLSVPSNLGIPNQTESYIVPITLNKPLFRIFFREAGSYRVTASHARFPFKTVVKEIRAGKSFYDVINYFEFQGSTPRQVLATKDFQMDFNIRERLFNSKVQVQAPTFPNHLGMLIIAMAESEGYLDPVDIKNFSSSESRTLVAPAKATLRFLSVLQPKDARKLSSDHAMSIAFSNQAGQQPAFIPLAASPTFRNETVSFVPPEAPSSLTSNGTYLALSDVETIDREDYRYERKFRKWEFYLNEWPRQVSIPQFPEPLVQEFKLRWEVSFLANTNGKRTDNIGPQLIESSSHASRNIADF
jgi:hypothetical protein